MPANDLPLLDSPPRDRHGRIDHSGCSHDWTPAGRKACRDHAAAYAATIDKRAARLLAAADGSWVMGRDYLVRAAIRLHLMSYDDPRDAELAARALAAYKTNDGPWRDGITWSNICTMFS